MEKTSGRIESLPTRYTPILSQFQGDTLGDGWSAALKTDSTTHTLLKSTLEMGDDPSPRFVTLESQVFTLPPKG